MRIASTVRNLDDLPSFLTIWLPLIVYITNLIPAGINRVFYRRYIDGELGATELLTLLFLAVALVGAVRAIQLARILEIKFLVGWLCLISLGCLYFFGEEASWGQHVFGWDTPDRWGIKNDQAETNLHNMEGILGSFLDQIPRNILTLCALLFGFAFPLWRIKHSIVLLPFSLQYWLLPTSACITAGFIASTGSLLGKVFHQTPWFQPDFGEIKELMIALFIMIYVLSILKRLRSVTKTTASSNTPDSAIL